MTGLRFFFIALAVLGTIGPWYFFAGFMAANDATVEDFIAALFVNGASAGLSTDIVISSSAFWVWSFFDAKDKSIGGWRLVVPASLLVGLSLALPAYLAVRLSKSQQAQAL